MQKRGKKKLNIILSIVIILVLIVIALLVYRLVGAAKICEDEQCFQTSLLSCDGASFIEDGAETILLYEILGAKGSKCWVQVTLLQVKEGSAELESLEDKKMKCELPLGANIKPESNIRECTGELREEIQEIMIQRMHAQLLENIGKIEEEFIKVI